MANGDRKNIPITARMSPAEAEALFQQIRAAYGDAVTRFTRTPVYFEPTSNPGSEVTGEFSPRNGGRISIDVPPGSPYTDVATTIGHEDIHAALNQAGLWDAPEIPFWAGWDRSSVPNFLKSLFAEDPAAKAREAFHEHYRAGDPTSEVPAYVAASPGDLGPEFTEADRQIYIKRFTDVLAPNVAEAYRRIAQNYTGSLQSPLRGQLEPLTRGSLKNLFTPRK